ncbi:tetratricopeptide repeat protein [Actinoplanes aureus]|uniref:Tetratricopeptide repeat protein n=1 Tax=Actinoplanes aureus TaxID=2792083 RepID=A0A931FZM2_9ACTN|nr:tetratricopeptide repeat protein [Actinoplanes aureus]MBG0560549.1 tetratricopeptide repeat protein [Actinoplanes aureus]
MRSAEELWGLLNEAYHLPYGAAQIALVEQVLRHVDAVGEPELAFQTRLFATNAYVYGGEPVKAFATFSWCVADFDRKPASYHERRSHSLLWLFKTMVNSMTDFPEVPLARAYAVLDDMERRYQERGHGMQAVYKHRYLVAKHVGHLDEADSWYEKWLAAPRDSLSDCAGCDPTTLIRHLNARGRPAEAVERGVATLAEELDCAEQPQGVLSELMEAYLKVGRLEEAADAHRRAYLIERNNLADLWGIAGHIQFCTRTGNEHRGLEILQRHIDWLDRAPSPAAAMQFAASGAALLHRIAERGHGDALIRRTGRDDIAAVDLAGELVKVATELAARFDARNGTAYQSELIAETLAAEPYGVELPLSATARRVPAPAVVPVVEPPAPVTVPELSAAELLDLGEQHWDEDRDDALAAVVEALGARFGEPAEASLAARLWRLRGQRLRNADDADGAVDAWERAIRLYTDAGDAGAAIKLRARIGLERGLAGSPGEGLAAVEADVAYHDEHGDPEDRAAAWLRLSTIYLMLDRIDDANEAGDQADRHAEQLSDPRRRAHHLMVRARNRAAADRNEEALEAARAGWEFYRTHGPARMSAQAAAVVGHLTEDAAETVAAFDETLAAGLSGPEVSARVHRGRALMRLGRPAEAVDDLVEAVALCAEQGMREGGVFARQDLAQAYRLADRRAEAVEVAEEALIGFERLGFEEPANDTRFLLASLYRDLGDSNRALGIYRDLIERLADNPAGRGQIGEEAGQVLYDLDRDSEAALTFRAAAEALREAGDLAGELRLLRRRLMALNYADELPEAEEVIRLATERYAELPGELAQQPGVRWGESIFAFEIGNLLMRRGRYAEAVPHLRGAPERLRDIGAGHDADRVSVMLAEALLRSGSASAAREILGALLAGDDRAAPVLDMARELYDEALEAGD